MRKNLLINIIERKIEVSNAFYKRACKYGTEEYRVLMDALQENPEFEVKIKTSKKKTYSKLTFQVMKDYIETLPDRDEKLALFEAAKNVAKTKGGLYPITKHWFLETFPEYNLKVVSESEIERAKLVFEEENGDSEIMGLHSEKTDNQKAA